VFGRIYTVFGALTGFSLGMFNFLQYFSISTNTEDNSMRLNYPMCIGYLNYVVVYHIVLYIQERKAK